MSANAKKPYKRHPPDIREKVLEALAEGQRMDPPISQVAIANRFGIHQTMVSKFKREAELEQRKAEKEAKRLATRAANKAAANGHAPTETTLLSRPSPRSVAVSRPRGERSFETVSLELAGAIDKVRELKRELRAMLGDD